jgi:hypothetical protein
MSGVLDSESWTRNWPSNAVPVFKVLYLVPERTVMLLANTNGQPFTVMCREVKDEAELKAALPEIRAAISRYLLESEADRSKGKARK